MNTPMNSNTTSTTINYAAHMAKGRQLRSQAVMKFLTDASTYFASFRNTQRKAREDKAQDCMSPACA